MNDIDVDVNKIITSLVKESAKSVIESVFKVGDSGYKKSLAVFELCFTKYLKRSHKRYSVMKTLLYRDKPVSIKSHFIQPDLRVGKNTYQSDQVDEYIDSSHYLIISGTAGCGKSTFMKALFLRLVESKQNGIPVFIELRHLNTDGSSSLYDHIYETLHKINDEFTREQLDYSLKKGKLVLLLDGFDEINYHDRRLYEKEISALSNSYGLTRIIISTRPDETLDSWEEFTRANVVSFDKEKAIQLISKIDYDTEVKQSFLDELEKDLFQRHEDFLSNPLLLTMMLLTYEQLAEIPNKIHIFYSQAFDTLYYKHDALKSLYKRKSYTGVSIDDFKRLLSAFSIISYADNKFSFSKEEVLEYIGTSKKLENIKVNKNDYLKDLVESVCILMKDGLHYTFTHRSFQEYFAAYFISHTEAVDKYKLIERVSRSNQSLTERVLSMLFEMNQELVEEHWIRPRLKHLLDLNIKKDVANNPVKYFSLIMSGIHVSEESWGFYLTEDHPEASFLIFLHQCYQELGNKLLPQQASEERKRQADVLRAAFPGKNQISFKEANRKRKKDWIEESGMRTRYERQIEFLTELSSSLTQKKMEKNEGLMALLKS